MRERTNEQWLADLRGPDPDEALADLYDLLVRGLRAGLDSYGGSVDANVEDFAQLALQNTVLQELRRMVDEELTDRQREAVVAVLLEEMPISEVARRMGTNQNALYKLLHDARRKLKSQMEAAGLSAEGVLAVLDEG